jgi:hypothetical protein|tara:strand:+ start:486 stop:995 length:510 start_codon:yes stop_codon:yes gene_type:complete
MDPNKVKKKGVLKALIQKEKANTQTESSRTGRTITGGTKKVKKANIGGEKVKEVKKTQNLPGGGTREVRKVKKDGRISKEVVKKDRYGTVKGKRKINRSTLGAFAKKVKAAFKKAKSTEDAYKPRTATDSASKKAADAIKAGMMEAGGKTPRPPKMEQERTERYKIRKN